jgi:cell division protein FtsL
MRLRTVDGLPAVALLALLLVVACLLLVTSQHRARGLFVEFGRMQAQAAELQAEGNRLRIELGKAAQPASVASAARSLGLRPADSRQTVFLPSSSLDVAAAAEPRR